jgi:ATP-dependent Clp protease ATP-binding subunit ClpC
MRAVDEANRRAHDYVGPEHLLLGLMRDEDAVSVAMCQRLGGSVLDVRRAVERRISRN